MDRKNSPWIILVIILVGFGLRIHQLGQDSFWNDEAGQSLAAIQPTISGMLEIVRSHAMAMPLDYFVAKVASFIGTTEFIMRFPAAVWGTLSLVSFFVLVRRLTGLQVSSLAVFLLTLSPPHLRFSQELRFYSALCFFYLWSNISLYKALKQGSSFNWGIYILVTFIGAYFHPYVLLSIFNGCGALLFWQLPPARIPRMFVALLSCGLILAILFIPGYEYFGAHQSFRYNLLQWGSSMPDVIFQGLGWLTPPYAENTPRFGMWELLNVIFATLGFLWICVEYKKYGLVLGFLLGTICQILLIISGDVVKGYWFTARQLIHLAPVPMILVAIGGVNLPNLLNRLPFLFFKKGGFNTLFRRCSFAVIICIFCLAVRPRITDYYRYQKSTGKQVVLQLLSLHQLGEPILVIPDYEEKIYRFYLMQAHADDQIGDLRPTTWQELPVLVSSGVGRVYLATSAQLSNEQKAVLESLGFTNLSEIDRPWGGIHALFMLDIQTEP